MINRRGMRLGAGPGAWAAALLDGLAPRVAAFLLLALLPLGLIALYQTLEVKREAERHEALALLASTEAQAKALMGALDRALGAAGVLDALAAPEGASGAAPDGALTCPDLGHLAGEGRPYAYVGFVPPDGPVACAAGAAPLAIAERADLPAFGEGAGPADSRLFRWPDVPDWDQLVLVLSPQDPLRSQAGWAGDLVLALRREDVHGISPSGTVPPLGLVTFTRDGRVLTALTGRDSEQAVRGLLPERPLAGEAGGIAPHAFEGRSASGTDQLYTVAPLFHDLAYIMAIWPPEGSPRGGEAGATPLVFPLLMWGASLLVGYWAIHRLVIRRVRDIGHLMRGFGRDRRLYPLSSAGGSVRELQDIEDAFRQTAAVIVEDEARMEDAFRERGVLLREVHHRVKNNLQLISSIISMQLRRLRDPRTRAILRRLQDRVLTLATIYRSLYTSADMAEVDAAALLRAVIEQEAGTRGGTADGARERAPAVDLDLEPMALDPDRAVPLAFLAAEAVSNALAHAGAAPGRPPPTVSLRREGERATLAVTNAAPPGPVPDGPERAAGLGRQLICAFAAQLGGPPAVSEEGGVYRLSVTFAIRDAPAQAA